MGFSRISHIKRNLGPYRTPSVCQFDFLNFSECHPERILQKRQPSNGLPSCPPHKMHSLAQSFGGLSSSFYLFNPISPPYKTLSELKCSSSSNFCQVFGSFGLTRSFSVTSTSWTLDSPGSNSFKGVFALERSCNAIDDDIVKLYSSVSLEIVEIIKHGSEDMEYKLNLAGSVRRIETITEIFRVLNHQKISGLRLFRWLRRYNPKWHSSAKVCSLIISNCGCLGDFETMRLLLLEFREEKICLDETAFTFLSLSNSSNDLMMDSVRMVLSLLDEVGGSCRNSGISALIEMLCNLCLFEMAKFVIEITERKDTHYNILLRHRCKWGHLEEARSIIKEMQSPTVKNYNYLLGSLCRNVLIDDGRILVEEMEENGVHPDEITFEIIIINSCIAGKLDIAKQLLNKMAEKRLLPRLSTHSAILKAFFKVGKFVEAHNYVIDSSVKCQQSGPAVYSLLADLHLGKKYLTEAQDIMIEMMDMDIRPNFRVYVKVLKQLRKTGQEDMAQDLENSVKDGRDGVSWLTNEGGIKAAAFTVLNVLSACARVNGTTGKQHYGKQLVNNIMGNNIMGNNWSTTLWETTGKHLMRSKIELNVVVKNDVLWTIRISGHGSLGVQLYCEMVGNSTEKAAPSDIDCSPQFFLFCFAWLKRVDSTSTA